MKFKLTFLSFISSISLCALTNTSVIAATAQEKAPRWFEVEVILFKQLGDKKLLKEQFTNDVQLPNYENYFDLLTPYLQPDIASLKQQLPQCEPTNNTISEAENPLEFITLKSLMELDAQLTETLVLDALSEISSEQIKPEQVISEQTRENFDIVEPVSDSSNNSLNSYLNETLATNNGLSEARPINDEYSRLTQADGVLNTAILVEEELQGLTTAQLALLNAAEEKFSAIQFIDTPRYPYFSQNKLCLVKKDILLQPLPSTQQSSGKNPDISGNTERVSGDISINKLTPSNNDLNGFPIQKVPTTINASGLKNDHQPYLINKDSLLLTDIINRLKWSKNFKPLLHLGWRQIGITRNKALPVKIFAGEHLEEHYQKAVNEQIEKQLAYEEEQQALLTLSENENMTNESIADEGIVNEGITNEELVQPLALDSQQTSDIKTQEELPASQALTAAQQQQVAQLKLIFENIALLNDAKVDDEKIDNKTLDEQEIKQLTATVNEPIMNDETADDSYPVIPLNKPIQPWLLDGFFKVHLDHYLYITADFNIAAKTASSSKNNQTDALQLLQAINFSQNKRVITGEVHYFDHPYIGMIVQIRRFDPTKPDDEAVTQAVR